MLTYAISVPFRPNWDDGTDETSFAAPLLQYFKAWNRRRLRSPNFTRPGFLFIVWQPRLKERKAL